MPNYLPCRNESCSSVGQSHPNCHCYDNLSAQELQSLEAQGYETPGVYRGGGRSKNTGINGHIGVGMAEGGEVEQHFCSQNRKHLPTCEYFAEGGTAEITPDGPITAPVNASQSVATAEITPDGPITPPTAEPAPEPTPTPMADLTPDGPITPPDSSFGQKVMTGIEGIPGVKSVFSGIRHGAEALGVPNKYLDAIAPSTESMTAREQENPNSALVGNVAGTIGETMLAPEMEMANLGKIGSSIVRGFVQNGTIQGANELDKYLMGQNNDPSEAASAILSAGALGGAFGLVTSGSSALLKKIPKTNLPHFLNGMVPGIAYSFDAVENKPTLEKLLEGAAANYPCSTEQTATMVKGLKFGNKVGQTLTSNLLGHGLGVAQTVTGYQEGGTWGALKGMMMGEFEGFLAKKAAEKVALPVIMKVIQSGSFKNILQGIDNAGEMSGGLQRINKGVGDLFQVGSTVGVNAMATEKQRDKLHEFISNGGVDQQIQNELKQMSPQAFAEGGDVAKLEEVAPSKPVEQALAKPVLQDTDFVSEHYPELGQVLGTAKGRISNYLNSQRPQLPVGQLPYDVPMQDPEKERSYNKALDIAIEPLSVLNHVKAGTLTPEHVSHLNSMYPELHDHLNKKITEQMLHNQLKKEKPPPFHVRQSMSMLMGTNLDSALSPSNIQAAQAVFAQKAQQAQAPVKNKKGTSSLSKSAEPYQTKDQAAEARQKNGH